MKQKDTQASTYALGYSEEELERLGRSSNQCSARRDYGRMTSNPEVIHLSVKCVEMN